MDALDAALVGLIAVLATALALMLLARLRDLRTLHAYGSPAEVRVRAQRLEAELRAARARIGELESGQGIDWREPEPAGRFSRR